MRKKIKMKQTEFREIFGNSPEIKVLEYFLKLGKEETYYSKMRRSVKVGNEQVYYVLNKLKKNKIVIEAGKIGIVRLYKVNPKSKYVKVLRELLG